MGSRRHAVQVKGQACGWGLGVGGWGLGCVVQCVRLQFVILRLRVQCLKSFHLLIVVLGCHARNLTFWGSAAQDGKLIQWNTVTGLWFGVWGLGFRVWGFECFGGF